MNYLEIISDTRKKENEYYRLMNKKAEIELKVYEDKYKEVCIELENINSKHISTKEEYEDTIKGCMEEIEDYKKNIISYENNIAELEDKLILKSKELQSKIEDKKDYKDKIIKELEEERAKVEENLKDLEEELIKSRKENNQLKKKICEISDREERENVKENKNINVEKKLLERNILSLEKIIEKNEDEILKLRDDIKEYKDEDKRKKKKIEELEEYKYKCNLMEGVLKEKENAIKILKDYKIKDEIIEKSLKKEEKPLKVEKNYKLSKKEVKPKEIKKQIEKEEKPLKVEKNYKLSKKEVKPKEIKKQIEKEESLCNSSTVEELILVEKRGPICKPLNNSIIVENISDNESVITSKVNLSMGRRRKKLNFTKKKKVGTDSSQKEKLLENKRMKKEIIKSETNDKIEKDPMKDLMFSRKINESFFTNLTFTDSSPVIKKPIFRKPKK